MRYPFGSESMAECNRCFRSGSLGRGSAPGSGDSSMDATRAPLRLSDRTALSAVVTAIEPIQVPSDDSPRKLDSRLNARMNVSWTQSAA